MSGIPINIEGKSEDGKKATVGIAIKPRPKDEKKKLPGLIVYQDNLKDFETELVPFVNPTFGIALNQNISFGGTPDLIDDGAAGGWSTTAVSGAWDFADAGRTSITGANNNDQALFERVSTIDMDNYVAITGNIKLDVYAELNNDITLEFLLGAVTVGNSINLNDYINTGDLATTQNFVISKEDMGLSGDIDCFTITIQRSGGAKPTMSFDDINIQETGGSAVFVAAIPPRTVFHVDTIRFTIAAPLIGDVPNNLSFDKLLNLVALPNGIILTTTRGGEVRFAVSLRNIGDMITVSGRVTNQMSDGVNTFITIETVLNNEFFVLKAFAGDSMTLAINDNLSALTLFNCFLIGRSELEIEN